MICDVQGTLIGARTPSELSKFIGKTNLPAGKQLPFVDAKAERWVFVVDYLTVSPLTIKKRWTKKDAIILFNKSKTAQEAGLEYPTSSLSSKRFDKFISELVDLILEANRSVK